ncbi:hypothetical protein P7K49_008477 [Saguinus oedipus]|uniref:Uncharacterized protein n=1 Tax=Saguinus oedipus TaxID=9490 RepID=A0ABQ9VXV4_SAGOE|nr:hypothetical protein P7K49_008477 [Saguinus oedipus]
MDLADRREGLAAAGGYLRQVPEAAADLVSALADCDQRGRKENRTLARKTRHSAATLYPSRAAHPLAVLASLYRLLHSARNGFSEGAAPLLSLSTSLAGVTGG